MLNCWRGPWPKQLLKGLPAMNAADARPNAPDEYPDFQAILLLILLQSPLSQVWAWIRSTPHPQAVHRLLLGLPLMAAVVWLKWTSISSAPADRPITGDCLDHPRRSDGASTLVVTPRRRVGVVWT